MKQIIRNGWVAMNKGEFDIENVSYFKSKKVARKYHGGKQDVLKVKVIFFKN